MSLNFNREKFFDAYRLNFGALTQQQVDGINTLLSAFEVTPVWNDLRHIAYAFATIKHETAHTFQPITEIGGDSYFKKYDGRDTLGNNRDGDGLKFKGRGFVQITGRKNYTRFTNLLSIDLVNNPKQALNPAVAFQIMTIGMYKGIFTGRKLRDYINDTQADYVNARRIINGLDKANVIAEYARDFFNILAASKQNPIADTSETEIDDLLDFVPAEIATPREKTISTPAEIPVVETADTLPEQPEQPPAEPEPQPAPIGDAPDVEPKESMQLEDVKPFVLKWLSRIWKGITGFNTAQLTTLTGSGFTFGGRYWWVWLVAGGTIFLFTVGVAAIISLVLGLIWFNNRREINRAHELTARFKADPNMKNLGLNVKPIDAVKKIDG